MYSTVDEGHICVMIVDSWNSLIEIILEINKVRKNCYM